ncbi:hypothetical protein LCGC14_1099410 [marine sediment metagenome]|uniref:Terminase large subunit gp17-like C-terminal domain-containing protein n=1 Tax=marine sediment metagenome TaxID=412755 RepID=A0A0F9MA06_9ZZZZ
MQINKEQNKLLARWRENPREFIQEAIIDPYNRVKGTRIVISRQQEEGIEAVRQVVFAKIKVNSGQRVTEEEQSIAKKWGISIMAGKGGGKDALASWVILWFGSFFPYPKIVCTSVSADQLNKVLWSEISKWLSSSLVKDWWVLQSDKLFFKNVPKDVLGKRWFAFPKTANPKASVEEQVETLAGIHEDYVMVVVDEGAGIPEAVFDPLEGTLSGLCNFLFMIFNPTRSKGYAVDSQYKNSDKWVCLQWNSEESEVVSRGFIENVLEKCRGDKSLNPYRIRILGLPPKTDEQTFFPWDWIEDAVARETEPLENSLIIKGLDCGAGGNKSVIATRKGFKVYPFKRNNSPDPVILTNWAGNDIDAERPDAFRVDVIGIGWAVEGNLREKKGSVVEAADSRKKAENSETFYNKRAEMYWNLREAFAKNLIDLPDDEDLKDQLGATKSEIVSGKTKIIDKKKIKEELGHSPDELDALALTFFHKDDLVCKIDKRNDNDDYVKDEKVNQYNPFEYIRGR